MYEYVGINRENDRDSLAQSPCAIAISMTHVNMSLFFPFHTFALHNSEMTADHNFCIFILRCCIESVLFIFLEFLSFSTKSDYLGALNFKRNIQRNMESRARHSNLDTQLAAYFI